MTIDDTCKKIDAECDYPEAQQIIDKLRSQEARLQAAEELADLVTNAGETWPKLKGALRRFRTAGKGAVG